MPNYHIHHSHLAPQTPHFEAAKAALDARDGAGAAKAIIEDLKANPHHTDLYHAIGQSLVLQGNYKAALLGFNAATTLSNQLHHFIHYRCSDEHTDHGLALLRNNQPDKATDAFSHAIFQDHYNATALYFRGLAYHQLEEPEAAKQDHAMAVQAHENALPSYETPLEIASFYHKPLRFLFDFDKHIRLTTPPPMEELLFAPPPADPHQKIQAHYVRDDYENAIALCTDQPEADHYKARALSYLGRHEEAIELFQTLDKEDTARFDLARAYFDAGNLTAAQETLSTLEATKETQLLQGKIALLHNNISAAITHLETAITKSKQDHTHYHLDASMHHYSRAYCYWQMGQYPLAYAGFMKALDLEPSNSYAHDGKQQVLHLMK